MESSSEADIKDNKTPMPNYWAVAQLGLHWMEHCQIQSGTDSLTGSQVSLLYNRILWSIWDASSVAFSLAPVSGVGLAEYKRRYGYWRLSGLVHSMPISFNKSNHCLLWNLRCYILLACYDGFQM